ncbi:MAG: SdrD B-like domain-containing protein, partial [Clostridia bacterium]
YLTPDGWQAAPPRVLDRSATYTFDDVLLPVTDLEICYDTAASFDSGALSLVVQAGNGLPLSEDAMLSLDAFAAHTYRFPTSATQTDTRAVEVHATRSIPLKVDDARAQLSGRILESMPDEVPLRGLPLVLVSLIDAKGQTIARTQSDRTGAYRFDQIAQGTYTIACDFTMLHAQTSARIGLIGSMPTVTLAEIPQEISPVAVRLARLSGRIQSEETPLPALQLTLQQEGQNALVITPDAQGRFHADCLLPGEYALLLSLPDSYLPKSIPSTITLPYGGALDELTLAITRACSISGHVTQPAASGDAKIVLLDGTGTICQTAVIDAQGDYAFRQLLPDAYTVRLTPPEDLVLAQETKTNTQAVDLRAGEEKMDVDFVLTQPISMSIAVWEETLQTGLEDILVTLQTAQGETIKTLRTDAKGCCQISGLPPADYQILLALSEGYVLSPLDDAYGATITSPHSVQIPLTTPGRKHSIRFDVMKPARLSGLTWLDTDDNGVYNTADQLLADVEISLQPIAQGAVLTTRSGADGAFSFDGITPGDYRLHFALPEGLLFARAPVGVTLHRWIGDVQAQTAETERFSLAAGESLRDVRVGAVVAGYVDGTLSAPQPLSGVVLTLRQDDTIYDTVTTDETGAFAWDQLRLGVYTLSYSLPEGYLPVTPLTQTINLRPQTPATSLALTAVRVASLDGTVWHDGDNDGARTEEELPFEGMDVLLYAVEDNRSQLIAQAHTNAQGHYAFNALYPGDYQMRFMLPEGSFSFSRGTLDTQNEWSTVIRVKPGQAQTQQDVGIVRLGQITGCAFLDTEDSGLYAENSTMLADVSV